MKKRFPKARLRASLLVLGGAVIFTAGAVSFHFYSAYETGECFSAHQHINADVVCGEGTKPVITKTGYASLKREIETFIETLKEDGKTSEVGVYFRDLKFGPATGVNERLDFSPASLLKVPLVMLYLREESDAPGFLMNQPGLNYSLPETPRTKEERRRLETSLNFDQVFPPPDEIVPGEGYSIEELMYRTMAYSDNKANELLALHASAIFGGDEVFVELLHDLGLIDPESAADDAISVRSYAGLFRLLYNVSYLSPEMSEKLLGWLSESTFDEGLEAGVPEGVRVAHKFGERELGQGNHQLHDCGIVYYPGNPYLLCVMTRGDNVFELAPVIATISRMVYEEVDSRRIK